MRRQAPALLTASRQPLSWRASSFNPVTRIGALTVVQAKKAALGDAIAAEFVPAKANPTKSLALSQGADVLGLSPGPLCGLLDAKQDIRAKRHVAQCGRQCDHGRRKPSVGAGLIHLRMRGKQDRECQRVKPFHRRQGSPLLGGPNGWTYFA